MKQLAILTYVVHIISHESTDVLPVSICPREGLQMVRELEGPDEPTVQRRRGGHVGRELRRLQQQVQSTLEDWLDYYRYLPDTSAFLSRVVVQIKVILSQSQPESLLVAQKSKKVISHFAYTTLLNSSMRILF